METRNFGSLVETQWEQQKFLCVGLDPDLAKLPASIEGSTEERVLAFNKAIIDATKDIVCAYKPNSAFYEALGGNGFSILKDTITYVHTVAPHVAVMYDAKRADIGNTNNGYVAAAFDYLQADAITVHPYMGGDSLREFLADPNKGVFVMCRNSNPGAGEFQDLEIQGKPLYLRLAQSFREKWNDNQNCGLVVGATYPEEIRNVRDVAPDMPFLIPGIGSQGGDLESSVRFGKDARNKGFILSTSRVILYASSGSDYADAARSSAQHIHASIIKALYNH